MNRIPAGKYAAFLAVLIVALGGIALAKQGLYIDRHEGDAAHMVDILLRMIGGHTPHLDFATPIGILAFLPIVAMMKVGLPVGQAFLAAQVLVAVISAPMIWRVAVSRLSGLAGWGFGLVTLSLILALVHGENVTALSVSMYYNRWAWAAAFIVIMLAVLPPLPNREASRLDGLIAGVLLAALALIKPTYFVAFVLPVAFGFVLQGAKRSLSVGLATGLVIALLVVGVYGVDFFPAYVADLLTVATSEVRAAPGATFIGVLNGPRFLIGSMTLIMSVIVLRQVGKDRAGLLLLLLAPGFIYVTYQNFGNDSQWLMLLSLLLLALRPERGRRVLFNADGRNAMAALALTAFALMAPSWQNMITSPVRLFATDTEDYVQEYPEQTALADLYVQPDRIFMPLAREALVDRVPELASYIQEGESFEPLTFLGETLPRCWLENGDVPLHAYMADRLKQPPFNYPPESEFFVADITSSIWFLGGFAPLEGSAPWYYGGTPGVENADAIVVPICPLAQDVTKQILDALELAGLTLRPPLRDPLMLVYPIVKE